MKFLAILFVVAASSSCAFGSAVPTYGPPIPFGYVGPAYVPSNPIQFEDLGRGFAFLCDLIPALYCDAVLQSLPPNASPGDAAAAIAKVASNLRPRNAGGVYSQAPVPRNLLRADQLSGSYAFVCDLIPSVDCDEIIQRLPPDADESTAAAVLASTLASLRFPDGVYAPPYYRNY